MKQQGIPFEIHAEDHLAHWLSSGSLRLMTEFLGKLMTGKDRTVIPEDPQQAISYQRLIVEEESEKEEKKHEDMTLEEMQEEVEKLENERA
jgi:hypothetical protein